MTLWLGSSSQTYVDLHHLGDGTYDISTSDISQACQTFSSLHLQFLNCDDVFLSYGSGLPLFKGTHTSEHVANWIPVIPIAMYLISRKTKAQSWQVPNIPKSNNIEPRKWVSHTTKGWVTFTSYWEQFAQTKWLEAQRLCSNITQQDAQESIALMWDNFDAVCINSIILWAQNLNKERAKLQFYFYGCFAWVVREVMKITHTAIVRVLWSDRIAWLNGHNRYRVMSLVSFNLAGLNGLYRYEL